VSWAALDDRSARATLADGLTGVTLTFRFGDDNLIDTVHADARARIDRDRVEYLPWEGRFWNYAERDGILVPLEGEVAWLLPAGRLPYWRGSLEFLAYEFAH